jgi:tricorn protease-like protein
LRGVIDEEVNRLPDKYRVPFVLCYLEGKTNAEAADQLGCPKGTILSRLARARERLRVRLTRRGLALSAATLGALLTQNFASALPATLVDSTIKASLLFATGRSVAVGFVSARIVALADGVLNTMFMTKLKIVASVLLTVGLVGTGAGVLIRPALADKPALGQTTDTPRLTDAVAGPVDNQPKGDPTLPAAGDPEEEAYKLRTTLVVTQPAPDPAAVLTLAISPDGKLLAWGGADNSMEVLDLQTGRSIARFQGQQGETGAPRAIWSVAFSPDGRTLATGSADKAVKLWEVASGKEVATLKGHAEAVRSVAFSPDGRLLASADADKVTKVWELATAQARVTFHLQEREPASTVAFTPDGKTLVSGSDNSVLQWDLSTSQTIRWPAGHSGPVLCVVFSPDGKFLATGSEDKTVRLWDVATGKELRMIGGHAGRIRSVAISPDSRTVASAGEDKTVRLWDVATGKELAILKDFAGIIFSVAFSRDGKTLIAGGERGGIAIWQVKERAAESRQTASVSPTIAEDRLAKLVPELLKSGKTDGQMIEALFLATLGRFPTEVEMNSVSADLAKKQDRRKFLGDLVHLLSTSKEFSAHVESLRHRLNPGRP